MNAWIALGLSVVWFAAGSDSSLNQPRPQSARPAPSSVIPASHAVADDDAETPPVVPPAPLPEFTDVEAPQILFEFSRPESCTDSQVCPPAPPAEIETAETPRSSAAPRFHRFHIQFSPAITHVVPCDAAGCDEDQAARALTSDQLQHLRQAIQHLDAAGMTDAASKLRSRHERAAAELRSQLRRELALKEAELSRLTQEVRHLQHELRCNDAKESSAIPTSGIQQGVRREYATEYDALPSVTTPLTIPIHNLPDSTPMPRPSPFYTPEVWRRTESLPIMPLSVVPDAEFADPLPGSSPIHLIPSPQTSGRPHLLFPMRSVEVPSEEPEFQLPPAPPPTDADAADSENVPVA